MRLLTPNEVAEILAVTVGTVYEWLRQGRIRSVRLGRLWRVREQDLEEYVERHLSDADERPPGEAETP